MRSKLAVLALSLALGLPTVLRADNDDAAPSLPRFTEEREAAALFFVKKNLPELVPFLEELKKNMRTQYEREIREIFQVTEMLAELMDDPDRSKLELEIWKTENRAHAVVAKLARAPSEEEAKKLETQLQELSAELVELEIKVLKLKADQLDKELGEVNDELAKLKDNKDRHARDRFQNLLDKARKMRKP